MTEQRDWYLSMLGISQYRQRQPGVAAFTTTASPVDVNKAMATNSDGGTVASSEDPSSTGFAGQVSQNEIITSLAGIRETLQADSSTIESVTALEQISDGTQASMNTRGVKESKAQQNQQDEKVQGSEQQSAAEQNIVQENISFTLACWQVSDELLLINGFTHGQRANRAQLELLANILRAIHQLPQGLPPAELIEWPLKLGADSSLTGAKTQLAMFLLGRQQVRPYRWLLAMGDEPARLLGKKEGEGTDSPARDSVETIFIPSLQSMLAEPLSKREAWHALRTIRGGG